PTFLYDSLGGKELNFNIIGYNPVGYACRYLAGSAADLKNSGLRLSFNALNLSNNTDKCDLPTEVLSSANKTIDISGVPFNSLLERHEKAEAVTGFLPLYFPLVAAGKEDLIDVDPEGKAICADIDQRGLARLPTNKLYYQPDNIARNSCDIGSVELMKLTAGDLRGLGNSSLTTLLEGYQTQYDTAEKNLTNPLYSYLWNVLKIDLANYKNLLDQTKANAKYRAIYIDLKANGLPLPNEDSSHLLKFFNSTDYNISLESVGTGLIDDKVASTEKDDKLFCEWNSALQQIIFYRSDDITTQAGDYNYCKYTISSKDGSTQSSGLLEARFDNVAPVASDSKVVFQYLANEIIPLNLLKYANDDGDGPANTLITKPNKPQFADLPIYLPSKTSKDGIFTVVKADREGPCPGEDKDNTCYGGNIYIQAKNSFNNFNDTLTYYVYDADNKISNAGTISLVSSNTTAGGGNSGGGGGSLGILSLASLLGLAAYRRYRK
ncbi:GlyGly-CTERM sorting domain-containing protein, partial [Acinetobacter pittii]|uniref:GlyGly-CTERM sorting domain-containing protein n=1 Tax=Acinetobacter pittii TaxID=48296 RepID=UPI0005CB2D7B